MKGQGHRRAATPVLVLIRHELILVAARAVQCRAVVHRRPDRPSGPVNRVNISAGSLQFLIDNARMGLGAWACEASCFANNPQPDLQEGLGTMEIKAETIRFVRCATSDSLEDAAFDTESWSPKGIGRHARHDQPETKCLI
jgi:hypothetical protein